MNGPLWQWIPLGSGVALFGCKWLVIHQILTVPQMSLVIFSFIRQGHFTSVQRHLWQAIITVPLKRMTSFLFYFILFYFIFLPFGVRGDGVLVIFERVTSCFRWRGVTQESENDNFYPITLPSEVITVDFYLFLSWILLSAWSLLMLVTHLRCDSTLSVRRLQVQIVENLYKKK